MLVCYSYIQIVLYNGRAPENENLFCSVYSNKQHKPKIDIVITKIPFVYINLDT